MDLLVEAELKRCLEAPRLPALPGGARGPSRPPRVCQRPGDAEPARRCVEQNAEEFVKNYVQRGGE